MACKVIIRIIKTSTFRLGMFLHHHRPVWYWLQLQDMSPSWWGHQSYMEVGLVLNLSWIKIIYSLFIELLTSYKDKNENIYKIYLLRTWKILRLKCIVRIICGSPFHVLCVRVLLSIQGIKLLSSWRVIIPINDVILLFNEIIMINRYIFFILL